MEIIPIISVSIAFGSLIIALIKFIQENKRIRHENEKLKKNQTNRIWLPKSQIEVIEILEKINGYKLSNEQRINNPKRTNCSRWGASFSSRPMSNEEREKYEKEENVLNLFYPLENDILFFGSDIESMLGFRFQNDLEDFFKSGNTNVKFVLPHPESIYNAYEQKKAEKNKNERKRKELQIEKNGIDLFLNERPLKTFKYYKTSRILRNILWIKNISINFEEYVFFHNHDTDIEFIKMKNKFIFKLDSNSDWEFTHDIAKLRSAKNSHKQLINDIINNANLLSFNQINLSSLWEKSLFYFFGEKYN